MPVAHTLDFSHHPYSVPVVLQDLAPAEALLQSLGNLAHLNSIIDDVFDRIKSRIGESRVKISDAMVRVNAAQEKIKTIAVNENRATTIFSANKFPTLTVPLDFQRVCSRTDKFKLLERGDVHMSKDQRETLSPNVDTSVLFTIFSQNNAMRSEPKLSDNEGGLGRLPPNLPSVSSILLFNSDENPYKTYNSLDNLEGVSGTDRAKADQSLHAAPTTIFEGHELPTFAGVQLDYKPAMGNLPMFAMPANLPLPKLAADVNFGGNSQQMDSISTIAPSNIDHLSLPSIETLLQGTLDVKPVKGSGRAPASASASSTSAASSAASSAPIAPAPPGTLQISMDASATPPPPQAPIPPPPMAPTAPSVPIPPPPPPMAPAAPQAPTAPPPPSAPVAPTRSPMNPSAPAGGGDRGDLLSSIRNAGGLKKAANRVIKERKQEEPAASSSGGGGDMMSALRSRLAMRHGAISGKQDQAEQRAQKAGAKPFSGAAPSLAMPDMASVAIMASTSKHSEVADDEW